MSYTIASKMPVEIIKKLQEERARKAADEASRVATAKKIRLETISTQKREENKRALFVAEQTEKILKESLVVVGLTRIKKELLKKSRLVDSSGGVSLIWNEVDLGNDNYEYSYINVEVNPDDESLTIVGQDTYNFQRRKWGNKKVIETALAHAFLEPGRHLYLEDDSGDDGVHGQDSGR